MDNKKLAEIIKINLVGARVRKDAVVITALENLACDIAYSIEFNEDDKASRLFLEQCKVEP